MPLVTWTVDRVLAGIRMRAGFTTRHGGASDAPYASLNLGPHVGDSAQAVARNRQLLADELGVEPAWMEQVHSDTVAKASQARTYPATDGLWIDASCLRRCEDGVERAAACVMVADCVPLLLLGTNDPVAAAVHVGRAGMLCAIAPKAIGEIGVSVDAIIGPSICGRCYEVPEQMREDARKVAPASAGQTSWGTASIDVAAGLRSQLEGLADSASLVGKIRQDTRCTFEDSDLYSHRRASAAGEPTGRFAGVVLLERIG